MIKLFDSHCHLQDPRILHLVPKLIKETIETGVTHFAVNGVSENDWHLVEQMSRTHPSVIPNFGLHPWFIADRSLDWLQNLEKLLADNPAAAVGEIGLDKGPKGKQIDFSDQVEVFGRQLELAKEIRRPASVHCVRAFSDLLGILESVGPFPSGVVLHSYLGPDEMVPRFSRLGAYFSFSGFLMSSKASEAERVVRRVPRDRILLETDSPDARPRVNSDSLISIDGGDSLNHPANIRSVLGYVAGLLGAEEREVAEWSYENAVRVFSYEGSKLSM